MSYGYLLHLSIALACVWLADEGYALELGSPWWCAALPLVAYALARAGRRAFLAGNFNGGNLLLRALDVFPNAAHAAAVLLFGWNTLSARWSGKLPTSEGWPALWLLLDLAPLWIAELVVIDARGRALSLPGDDRRAARAFQLRMAAAAFLPIVLYFLIGDLVARAPALQARIESIALLDALWATGMLALFALGLPFLLRLAWRTHAIPAESSEGRALAAIAERARFRCRELLLWDTGGQMANAAILGATPGTRVVLFTDELLRRLSLRELAAVFAHEIGHARKHHVLVFACWTLGLLLGGELVLSRCFADQELVQLVGLGFVLIAWWATTGYLSRRFELEADLHSLEVCADPDALISALERVTGFHSRRERSWRHFSTAERVLFLRAASGDPGVAARLRRALARWRWVAYLACALVLCLQALRLARDWPRDLVAVDLRLGRYASARERLRATEVEPELAALVRRAASLAVRGPVEPEELAARAEAGLRAGAESEEIAEWLDLAAWRGRRDCRRAAEELRALELEGSAPDARRLEPRWSAALSAWRAARAAAAPQ